MLTISDFDADFLVSTEKKLQVTWKRQHGFVIFYTSINSLSKNCYYRHIWTTVTLTSSLACELPWPFTVTVFLRLMRTDYKSFSFFLTLMAHDKSFFLYLIYKYNEQKLNNGCSVTWVSFNSQQSCIISATDQLWLLSISPGHVHCSHIEKYTTLNPFNPLFAYEVDSFYFALLKFGNGFQQWQWFHRENKQWSIS